MPIGTRRCCDGATATYASIRMLSRLPGCIYVRPRSLILYFSGNVKLNGVWQTQRRPTDQSQLIISIRSLLRLIIHYCLLDLDLLETRLTVKGEAKQFGNV
jgi:hypothetical protein